MQQVGPYRVLGELGRGGMGVVYRGVAPDGRPVALKLLLDRRLADAHAQRRFQREVHTLSRLRHPHVVSLLDAGAHQGVPWLALELVQGPSLASLLARGPLPIDDALEIAGQLARALDYVHACGVVHRDLKPANVLLSDRRARLTDFGIARDLDASTSSLTRSGALIGTPGYAAPELVRGEVTEPGPAVDVYGLGAVLYACLTSRAPYAANSLQALFAAVERPPTPPRVLREDVPAWLDALCMECLDPDPARRPAAAGGVARRLLAGAGLGSGRHPATGRQHLAARVALGVAALALAGGVVWASRSGAGTERPALEARDDRDPEAEPPVPRDPWRGREFDDDAAELAAVEQALALGPGSYDLALRRGQLLRALGRGEAALEACEQGLRTFPEEEGFHALRCALALDLEPGPRARELALDFLQRFPGSARACYAVGSSYLVELRPAEALEFLDRAVALDPDLPNVHHRRSLMLVQLGRPREAEAAARREVAQNPKHADATIVLGELALQRGDRVAAQEWSERALELSPEHLQARLLRARLLEASGAVEEALAAYGDVLERAPDPTVHCLRAELLFARARYREALADYDRALELAPALGALHARRASALAQLGRDEDALAACARALRVDPGDLEAWNVRGVVLTRQGKHAQAAETYSRALEVDPRLGTLYLMRGLRYLALQRYAEALADFDRAAEAEIPRRVDPGLRARAERGAATVRPSPERGSFLAKALAEAEAALAANPGDVTPHRARAQALLGLGRLEEALRACEEAEARFPGDARLGSYAVEATLKLGRRGEAEALARRLVSDHPEEGRAWSDLGVVRLQAGALEEALRALDRALELDPGLAEVHARRAVALSFLGRRAEAAAAARRELERDPRYVGAWLLLGEVQHDEGELEQAVESLDRALELEPNRVAALKLRGSALERRGDLPGALRDYTRAVELQPSAEHHLLRSRVLQAGERPLEALAAVDRALELDPRHGLAHAARARSLAALGRVPEALAACDVALEHRPQGPLIWRLRGTLLNGLERWVEAEQALDRALALGDPKPGDLYVERARSRLRQGRAAAADEDLERARSSGMTLTLLEDYKALSTEVLNARGRE